MHTVNIIFDNVTTAKVSTVQDMRDFTNISIHVAGLGVGDYLTVYGAIMHGQAFLMPLSIGGTFNLTTNKAYVVPSFYRFYQIVLTKATANPVTCHLYGVANGSFPLEITSLPPSPTAGTPLEGGGAGPSGLSEMSYNNSAYTNLITVPMIAGDIINVDGLSVVGNVEAIIELVTIQGATVNKSLVGKITESSPVYSPEIGPYPINITAQASQSLILRIQSLRVKTGQAAGRLFARKM